MQIKTNLIKIKYFGYFNITTLLYNSGIKQPKGVKVYEKDCNNSRHFVFRQMLTHGGVAGHFRNGDRNGDYTDRRALHTHGVFTLHL